MGKGDNYRPVDRDKYEKNYDLIFNPKKLKGYNMKPTKQSLIPYYKKLDLASREEWREYIFPNNEVIRIENPQFLIISDNGHRIGAGIISYYIPYGWIQLRWKNKPEQKEGFYCENPDKMKVESIKNNLERK